MRHSPDIPAALSLLSEILGDRLSTGESILDLHSRDEAYSTPQRPDAVAFPETTDEVSRIVRVCADHHVPVIPYGMGTSLEGHVIPVRGGVTLDMSRMNRVLAVNAEDLDAVVQPGVTRTQLNEELRSTGLMFTVDPGADATMGGMAATRASGTNTVRYGTMRENVIALEVVLPDGEIIRTGCRARKSAAGYDLTHLFIGSEGTLGVITELTVRLFGQPEVISAATCAFDTVEQAVDTVILSSQLGLPLARIELLDDMQMRGMNKMNPEMNLPEKPHLFLEFHGSEAGVAEQVETFSTLAADNGASDFAWANRPEDRSRLWQARHNAYYAGRALQPGATALVTDCAVPISKLAPCIARVRTLIEESGMVAPLVGHVGDGNFHLLILIKPDDPEDLERGKALASQVNHVALEFEGTVTGEHGVGIGKKKYMPAQHGAAYRLMAQLKAAIDPADIMNPGKMV